MTEEMSMALCGIMILQVITIIVIALIFALDK